MLDANNILQRKQERAQLVTDIRSLMDEFTDKEMPEEKRNELSALETRFDNLNRTIDTEERQLQRERIIGEQREEPTSTEFREFGEFLQTARFNPNDSKLENRFQNMAVGAQGGFIVPELFSNSIKMVDDPAAIFRPRAQVIPAGDPPDAAITIPALNQGGANGVYAGVTVTWIGEGDTKPETEAAFRELKLEPKEVAAHVVVTDKLLRNSAAVGSLVSSLLRKTIIAAEEDAFLSGGGGGQPVGILNHPATINVVRAAAGNIGYADVVGMYSRVKFGGRLAWIASPSTLPELMTMADPGAAGTLIWQPNARDGAPGSLMGLPLLINDQSPVLGANGDLMLVDLDYYLIKDGSGISISASEHPLFTQNRTIIKAFWNVDGQPWLTTPLLLRDGVTTVSPFVQLN